MKNKRSIILVIAVTTLLLTMATNPVQAITYTFTQIFNKDDGNAYRDSVGDAYFIFVACGGDGLRIYNRTSHNLLTTVDDGGYYYDVSIVPLYPPYYIFVACGADGLRCYNFTYVSDLSYSLTLADTIDNSTDSYYKVFSDGTYIFTGCGTDGIIAYSFDFLASETFTYLNTQYDGGSYYGISWDAVNYYVACDTDGLRAYTFDGANFAFVDSALDTTGAYHDVWVDPLANYIYTAISDPGAGNGTIVYTCAPLFNLEYQRYDGTDGYYDISGNATNVYYACLSNGARAYTQYNGINMSLLSTKIASVGSDCVGVYAEFIGAPPEYIYYCSGNEGLYVYTLDSPAVNPTVATTSSVVHSVASATLNGNIVDDGGGNITGRGFEYGKTTGYGTTVYSSAVNPFNYTVIGLSSSTTYHFRAFATNSNGTGYGGDLTFSTSSNVNWTTIFDGIGRMFTGGTYTDPSGVSHTVTGIFGGGFDTQAIMGLFIFIILFILTAMWGLGILIGSVAIIPSVFAVIGYIPELRIIVAIVVALIFGLGFNRFIRR
jgi:hypothetical protein